ncbi:helix-turn-helix domain-containing protein [Streptomyces viridiviolaceus]
MRPIVLGSRSYRAYPDASQCRELARAFGCAPWCGTTACATAGQRTRRGCRM